MFSNHAWETQDKSKLFNDLSGKSENKNVLFT